MSPQDVLTLLLIISEELSIFRQIHRDLPLFSKPLKPLEVLQVRGDLATCR